MALSVEQRNDLRKRVLMNQPLTLEEAREIIESLRVGAGAAVLTGESKAKRASAKKGVSDEQLDSELDSLLKFDNLLKL